MLWKFQQVALEYEGVSRHENAVLAYPPQLPVSAKSLNELNYSR